MKNTLTLKRSSEFMRVFKRGRFFAGKYLVLYVVKNNLNLNRLGISVGKKVGKSVRRNRVRRLIRENYRLYEGLIKKGIDLVFVARVSPEMPDFYDLKKEMGFLLDKLNVFEGEKKEG